jgi:site-specific DNA-methyltransferase (adenine-specific)
VKFRQFTSQKCNWHTPKTLYADLDAEFHFNDDPCPEGGMFGTERAWGTSTFCNPPYGPAIAEWLKKGVVEAEAGKTVVFLLPARTDVRWFHDIVLPNDPEIRFIKGRLKFTWNGKEGRPPFLSMLVIFRGKP